MTHVSAVTPPKQPQLPQDREDTERLTAQIRGMQIMVGGLPAEASAAIFCLACAGSEIRGQASGVVVNGLEHLRLITSLMQTPGESDDGRCTSVPTWGTHIEHPLPPLLALL